MASWNDDLVKKTQAQAEQNLRFLGERLRSVLNITPDFRDALKKADPLTRPEVVLSDLGKRLRSAIEVDPGSLFDVENQIEAARKAFISERDAESLRKTEQAVRKAEKRPSRSSGKTRRDESSPVPKKK